MTECRIDTGTTRLYRFFTNTNTLVTQMFPGPPSSGRREKTSLLDRKHGRWGNPALSAKDAECGQEVPKLTKEKIARKAGYQSPIDNGQFMKTKPRLDDSDDTVAPFCANATGGVRFAAAGTIVKPRTEPRT